MLAPRIAIKGEGFITHPCPHDGIRCKHHQYQRPSIPEYPVSALDQFGARIVASEKGCGESDAISQEIHLTSHIHIARSLHYLCCSLSRRIDSERCTHLIPFPLSNSQSDRLPCRHSIIRIEFRIRTPVLPKSFPLREVLSSWALLTEEAG